MVPQHVTSGDVELKGQSFSPPTLLDIECINNQIDVCLCLCFCCRKADSFNSITRVADIKCLGNVFCFIVSETQLLLFYYNWFQIYKCNEHSLYSDDLLKEKASNLLVVLSGKVASATPFNCKHDDDSSSGDVFEAKVKRLFFFLHYHHHVLFILWLVGCLFSSKWSMRPKRTMMVV